MKRTGLPPENGRYYQRRPGAYVILLRDDLVLITHQLASESEFQLPGGGIDAGESPISALHREVFEETGWRMRLDRRLGFYRRFTFMPEYDMWAEKICSIYLGRPTIRLGQPTEAGHTPLWVHRFDAPQILTNSGDADFVQAVSNF